MAEGGWQSRPDSPVLRRWMQRDRWFITWMHTLSGSSDGNQSTEENFSSPRCPFQGYDVYRTMMFTGLRVHLRESQGFPVFHFRERSLEELCHTGLLVSQGLEGQGGELHPVLVLHEAQPFLAINDLGLHG